VNLLLLLLVALIPLAGWMGYRTGHAAGRVAEMRARFDGRTVRWLP
jgi:hypothetical protein